MQKFSLSLALCSLIYLTSGCGALKNMDQMNATTSKMNTTMEGMDKTMAGLNTETKTLSGTTDGMAHTTEKMSDGVSFTYSDMRIANTRDARQNALEAIEKTDDQAAKLGYASEYFASMEYQFWKPQTETPQDREDMKNVAVKDFFRKVKEYIGDRNAFNPQAADAKSKNLFALAGTLHYVNLSQVNALKGSSLDNVTMLSMIEDGLKAKAKVQDGTVIETDLPEYQAEVLRNEQDAIYLLRVRQNFLKAMAVSLASSAASGDGTARSPEFMQFMQALGVMRTAMAAGTPPAGAPPKWKPNFDSRNSTQVNYMATVLQYAAADLEFLKSQTIDAKSDTDVLGALSLMDLASVSRTEPAQAKAIDRFTSALGAVLAQ
jgi:hypothetical protein